MYSLLLILGLMVMGGAIAFIGDRVGMRVGRRRLSLFGLRPRHTSIIITVVSGVLIAGTSLAILAGASNEVRLALFRIGEIQRTLAENRAQLHALETELQSQRRLLDEARQARDQAQEERGQAVAQRDQALQEMAEARQRLDAVQQELARARGDLDVTRRRLEETRKSLEFQVARVDELKTLGETLAQRAESLQAQVGSLERTERELSDAIITLWNTAQRLQYGNVAFQRDEIVLADVLQPAGSPEQAEAALLAFLKRVEGAAQARAGGAGEDKGVVRLSQEEFDDQVKILASGKGPWVVRARATRNTLAGEPVLVYLELVPRGLAFRKGQVVAEKVVEASRRRPEDEVLDLLRLANDLAIRYGGMITGPDGTVGKLVTADAFSAAIEALRQATGTVRLVAVAAEDTYNTEGPLRIQLRVESGASSAAREPVDRPPTTPAAG